MIDIEQLEQRLKETEVRFNAAKIAKDLAEAEVEAKDNECLRIQGEFRAIRGLIDEQRKANETLNREVAQALTPAPEVHVEGEPADPSLVPVSDAPTDSLEDERRAAKKGTK